MYNPLTALQRNTGAMLLSVAGFETLPTSLHGHRSKSYLCCAQVYGTSRQVATWGPVSRRPHALIRGSPGAKLSLEVTFHSGRKHLPIVKVNRAA